MLMMKTQWPLLIAFLFVAGLFTPTVSAGTIAATPAPVASGPGLGLVIVPGIVTANPSNDNQVGGEPATDNNLLIPLKRFDHNDYIDLVFFVNGSTATTEYKVTEFVDDNTGVNWSKYTMQLGFGTGALFQLAGLTANGTGLDFDAPGYDAPPTSGVMPIVSLSQVQLVFSGGTQGTGASPYTFRIDVPNGIESFTLRQIPTPVVPEPSTMLLVGLAFSIVAACRRSR
jgi:hypothetical protein